MMEDTTEQEREGRTEPDPHAETAERLDQEAEASGEQSFMSIGGVDVGEMMRSHEQFPPLDRWHHTSTALISDIYDLLSKTNRRVAELEAQLTAANERIAELDPPKDADEPKEAN